MEEGSSCNVALARRPLPHGRVRRRTRRLPDPKLPVVKVNPFMSERQHTWSKDKSLPEFYEKPDVVHNSTESFVKPPPTAFSTSSDSMLTTRENRPILPLSQSNLPNLEAGNVSSSPPKTSPGKIRLFETPAFVESPRFKKVVFPPTPRDQCISPENPIKRLPKHGFAPTIVDREKKTVVESPVTKPTSLLNRERTQDFVTKQQVLRLKGLRMMDGGRLAPAPSTYLKTGAMPMNTLEDFYRQLVNSYNRGYAFSPTKTRHSYNAPTQMMYGASTRLTDSLVAVNSDSSLNRMSNSFDTPDSKSAFRILEDTGKPTCIEQTLERDYTMFYDTTKQGAPAVSGHHFTRFLKLKNYNPTQGELFIMVNKEQNRPGNWSKDVRQPQAALASQSATPRATILSTGEVAITDIPRSPSISQREDNPSGLTMASERATPSYVETPVAGRESKTSERIEIMTTLPDINSTTPN